MPHLDVTTFTRARQRVDIAFVDITLLLIVAAAGLTLSARAAFGQPSPPASSLSSLSSYYASIGVRVRASSEAALTLEYTPKLMGYDTIKTTQTGGKRFIMPRIEGARAIGVRDGEPMWIELRIPVAVPSSDGFRLGAVQTSSVRQIAAMIAPKPSLKPRTVLVATDTTDFPQTRTESIATSEFIPNESAYTNAPTPDWCRVEYMGIGRDRHIAHIILRAARFDATSGAIQLPTTITMTLTFLPAILQADPLTDRLVPHTQSIGASGTSGAVQVRKDNVANTTQSDNAENESNESLAAAINYSQTSAWRVVRGASVLSAAQEAVEVGALQQNKLQQNNLQQSSALQNNTPSVAITPKDRDASLQEASGRWYRIAVTDEGICRIDAATLRANGITITPQEISTIRIFGNGGPALSERVSDGINNAMREQPLIIDSTGGQLNAITFYAAGSDGWLLKDGEVRHFINQYNYVSSVSKRKTNYYLLNVGGKTAGQRAQFVETMDKTPTMRPNSYTARSFWEEEVINPSNRGSGQRWYGVSLASPWTLPTKLDNLTAGNIFYRYSIGCYRSDGKMSGGLLTVTESGQVLTQAGLQPTIDYQIANMSTYASLLPVASLPAAASSLQFSYKGNSTGDVGVVDWVEVHYPRALTALNNTVDLFTESTIYSAQVAEYTIGGFSSSPIYIVDISDRSKPVYLRNHANVNGQAYFKADFDPSSPRHIFISSQTTAPGSITPTTFADLRSADGADIVVVTHKDLLTSAQAYKAHRESQSGLKVLVATTEDIYNEFSGGTPDPTAIRDFLAVAYRSWNRQPRFALLWGNGHYDFRGIEMDITKPSVKNYVPTFQAYSPDGILDEANGTTMTEDYFARIVGDDPLTDIALGRMPALITNDGKDLGTVMVDKIRRYETASAQDAWRTRIQLISDDSPTSEGSDGQLHTNGSEDLSKRIPDDLRLKKIYEPDYPAEVDTKLRTGSTRRPAVNQDIISNMNAGSLIVNWTGHGSPTLWAHEQVFTNDLSIPLLTNANRLFFLTAATCDYSRFDNPRVSCGPQLLLWKPDGGAIGIFAATRVVYANYNDVINQTFYSKLFEVQSGGRTPTLGEALYAVKQTLYAVNDQKFCLLGDPAMRLVLPQQRSVLTKLAGTNMESTISSQAQPQLKALQKVDMAGYVRELNSTRADVSFNGNVSILLYDSDVRRRPVDLDGVVHDFMVLGGLLNAGAAAVRNGQFSTSLVIPKDISFSNLAGRLFIYAVDTTNRKYARGFTTSFTVGDVDGSAVNDGKGPEVKIYMEDRTFRAGDYVSPNPTLIADLFDQTGLNATGSGIGHDIQCWLDNATMPLTLTPSFTPSLEDARRGTVSRQFLNLTPGLHRLRVRAWDVFNNFSEAETWFRVDNGTKPVVTEAVSYPSPAGVATTIQFRHNQALNAPLTMNIYSMNGMLVRSITTATNARTMELLWDGCYDNGLSAPSGVYFYRVTMTDVDGNSTITTGKTILVR
jgi:hypothetical protein